MARQRLILFRQVSLIVITPAFWIFDEILFIRRKKGARVCRDN